MSQLAPACAGATDGLDERSSARIQLLQWHRKLVLDKGSRAALRRAESLVDCAVVPAFHGLVDILRVLSARVPMQTCADVASILSRIERNAEGRLGQCLNKAQVSESRLRALVRLTERDEVAEDLRRLALRCRELPVVETAECLVFWGESRAAMIAEGYYVPTKRPRARSKKAAS